MRSVARRGGFIMVLTGCWAMAACGPAAPVGPKDSGSARRIVTLSPHLAELVYSAGAGDRLVGVVAFSDFPPAVRSLPKVGDAFRVDYEALVGLDPDLVLAWASGNPPEIVERLGNLGVRVVALEPRTLGDIAAHIERIGELAGTSGTAAVAATGFRQRLDELRQRGKGSAALRVFVQLQARPYITVTDRHFLGQAVRLCGGDNVFGDLPGLTATVALESVVEAEPQVIVVSDMGADAGALLAAWQIWPDLPAVKAGAIYALDADLLSRPSLRILDGAQRLCADFDAARARLH